VCVCNQGSEEATPPLPLSVKLVDTAALLQPTLSRHRPAAGDIGKAVPGGCISPVNRSVVQA